MKSKEILFVIFIFAATSITAQKSFFFELGGTGGIASINHENIFYDKESFDISYRVGFSFAPVDKNNGVVLIFPVVLNGIIGKTKHKIEFGIGQSISITTKGQPFIMGNAIGGYRYSPLDKNYYLRLSYTPIISYIVDFQWQHWAGVSFGYKF